MKDSGVESVPEKGRVLNAVALQNAVLCAECDVVSDSPNDQCLVCGSRSLFNIARMFGGNLPKERASLITHEAAVRFWLGERQYLVEAMLDQWYDPESISYKVRADDGNLYMLRQRTSTPDGTCELVSFRRVG